MERHYYVKNNIPISDNNNIVIPENVKVHSICIKQVPTADFDLFFHKAYDELPYGDEAVYDKKVGANHYWYRNLEQTSDIKIVNNSGVVALDYYIFGTETIA